MNRLKVLWKKLRHQKSYSKNRKKIPWKNQNDIKNIILCEQITFYDDDFVCFADFSFISFRKWICNVYKFLDLFKVWKLNKRSGFTSKRFIGNGIFYVPLTLERKNIKMQEEKLFPTTINWGFAKRNYFCLDLCVFRMRKGINAIWFDSGGFDC